ncbi:MAG: DNA polymerase III subunit delta' [Gammaproteobacteria bacterium]|nr:DNA polymerase III subunit delta' [Gammaproteobacteria bacterium]MCW8923247.1 DNA polymerase III subunit delta' [Gammaproteobacteria bacterium]
MIYPWQQQQWHRMMQLKQVQHMPHAVLLYGEEGSGKVDFAQSLATALLCRQPGQNGEACGHCDSCRLIAAQTHPDFSVLKPIPPEKTKSKKPVLNIRIDEIRRLCSKLSSTSQYEGYRIAIIEKADKMLVQAANALLKTLEEPGDQTLIILVTSRPHRLPVTVRSRCQSLRFPQPGEKLALGWLQAQGIKMPEVALKYAHGAPLRALNQHEESLEQRELLAKALLARLNGESSLAYAPKLANLPKDISMGWLMDWVNDLVRLKNTELNSSIINEKNRPYLIKLAQGSDLKRIFALNDMVIGYIRKETIALNLQLVWENLLISWDSL